ncbi:MAG: hypothetical protein R3B47_03710 [Bacteroidia bacterium]
MNTRDSILIDKFLRKELTAREAHDWEKIKKRPEVIKELAFRRDLMLAAIPEGRISLKKELRALEAGLIIPEEDTATNAGRSSKLRPLWSRPQRWAAVAGLGLLLAIGWYVSRPDDVSAGQKLYAKAWKAYPNELTLRVRGAKRPRGLIDDAMLAYDNGEYHEAVGMLIRIAEPADTIAFYRANAYLAEGEIGVAKGTFEIIFQTPGHPYRQVAEWYLALIDIRENAWESAKTRLNAIGNSPAHPFASQAQELLGRLSKEMEG